MTEVQGNALPSQARRGERGLVYSGSLTGHRGNYVRLLTEALGFAPAVGPFSVAMLARLVRADRLCFAMIEDSIPGFLLVSAVRAILGRPTFALLLRPQTCFDQSGLRYQVKRAVFGAWRRLPGQTVATILPFSVDPRFATVAKVGLHDPELWDLAGEGGLDAPPTTVLSEAVRARALGRRIVVMPGALNHSKAFGAFSSLAARADLAEGWLFVAAGTLDPREREAADRLVSAGGLLVDRRLTDEELQSLYGMADRVWACYDPAYDQASGIFGRAVQLGVVAIVREGSRIHRLAQSEGLTVETLAIGPEGQASRLGGSVFRQAEAGARPTDAMRSWRALFWSEARRALALAPPHAAEGPR